MSELFQTPSEAPPPRPPPSRRERALLALAGLPLALACVVFAAPVLLMAESGRLAPGAAAYASLGALAGVGFALPQLGVVRRPLRFVLACGVVAATLAWWLAEPLSALLVALFARLF